MRIWDCELWRHKCNAARANFCICVSACLCVCLCVSVCERLYFWDKNMVLLQKKGPVGIVDTVIKQPETLTRRQGRGNNITWGWIKENLNNIICVAFVNSLPCSHSLSYIQSPMLMTCCTYLWHAKSLFFCGIYMKPEQWAVLMGGAGFLLNDKLEDFILNISCSKKNYRYKAMKKIRLKKQTNKKPQWDQILWNNRKMFLE